MGTAVRSLVRRTALVTIAVSTFLALCQLPAHALSLAVPAHALDRVDVGASLTASDHAGVLLLYRDGALVRSLPATSTARTWVFKGVPLAAGSHHLRVVLRSSEGLSETVARDIVSWRKPVPPILVSPTTGYAASTVAIVAKAGPGTTKMRLLLNGKVVTAKNASAGQILNMGAVRLAAGVNTVVLEASNPVSVSSGTFKIRRLDFPWPTCIVIDKSEFKLYWVKNGVLIKTYPVAIGKSSSETPERTWRVGEKYVYDYWGIYGPRRLRLYKQVGSSFVYSAYGVHGTNQEWVIGTKASHGCIRMYNKDILELYPQVPLYTMVQTRD